MEFSSLSSFLKWAPTHMVKGPFALIFAEDDVQLSETIDHHAQQGFKKIIVFGHDVTADTVAGIDTAIAVNTPIETQDDVVTIVNAVQRLAPKQWFYFGYNAEFFYYPFAESRSVGELAVFLTEERRDATVTFVIDIYAGDLNESPDGVNPTNTYLDRSGYYGLDRTDAWNNVKDRQMNFFGGLKRRFEEHIPQDRRRIDRVAFFRSAPGLTLQSDFTFNIDEHNTVNCPWHNNVTTAIASYRTAKALKRNPGSTFDIHTFWWNNSDYFNWNSQQIMDLGLMEPGQWF